ncbi:MAG: hypothetical protein ABIN89_12815 [Chitinophagaceae bacterium]
MGRHDFNNASGFVAWPANQNDRLSSFKFKLPVGWELRIHEHSNSNSRYKAWRGSGFEVRVNKNELPGFIHDEASGHSWIRLYYPDILQAFNAVQPGVPTPLFITKPGAIVMPSGFRGDSTWHQQGIQKTLLGEFVVSGSSPGVGYLYFTNNARTIVNVVTPIKSTEPPNPNNCNHLGGFQVAGSFLAVGYERFENRSTGTSKILFYYIANIYSPIALDYLTITRNRSGDTAGAVALIFLGNCWMVMVANWDAARLDFYTSNLTDLRNNAARFSASPIWSWSKATHGFGSGSIDNNWGGYQNINLFIEPGTTPRLDNIWFVGMHENWADLYHLNLGLGGPVVTKKGNKQFGGGQSFTSASGLYYDATTKAFEVYSAEAHINDGITSRLDRWI